MSIYALKVSDEMTEKVYESLNNDGLARYGWSYVDTADLLSLKVRKWNDLTSDEKKCWKANFLLEIQPEDYVVYINVPSYGKCTLAKVMGTYEWRKISGDFNHCIPIDKNSIRAFDRNDKAIPSILQRRFKLQGKYWKIYCIEKFMKLVKDLEDGMLTGENSTANSRLELLKNDLNVHFESISKEIHKHHAEKTLEELIKLTFEKMPNVQNVTRYGGSADKGADLIVTYSSGLDIFGIDKQERCAVQIKSYVGDINWDRAIEDIKNSFVVYEKEDVTCGLIITTATGVTEDFIKKLDELRENSGKPVGFIYGAELAKWFIKYGM